MAAQMHLGAVVRKMASDGGQSDEWLPVGWVKVVLMKVGW